MDGKPFPFRASQRAARSTESNQKPYGIDFITSKQFANLDKGNCS